MNPLCCIAPVVSVKAPAGKPAVYLDHPARNSLSKVSVAAGTFDLGSNSGGDEVAGLAADGRDSKSGGGGGGNVKAAGILYKWVNYGKGWRSRWFVLQDGVLSYYKVRGSDKISVGQASEAAGVRVIGEGSFRRKRMEVVAGQVLGDVRQWKPFGEIHLKMLYEAAQKQGQQLWTVQGGNIQQSVEGGSCPGERQQPRLYPVVEMMLTASILEADRYRGGLDSSNWKGEVGNERRSGWLGISGWGRGRVASIRCSKSDEKRLSIFTGTKTLHLRCDSREDRSSWMEALLSAKDLFPRFPTNNDLATSLEITISTEKLRSLLLEEGLNETVIKECESIMLCEALELHNQLRCLQQKHVLLLDALRQLETEKLELETTVIHEMKGREANLGHGNGRSSATCEGKGAKLKKRILNGSFAVYDCGPTIIDWYSTRSTIDDLKDSSTINDR
ncbi:Oxysterol-binding protein-related protein 1D [Platanthera guangdongensis]|uniref:Oxysterol-binding protein-related protein 1D n=1 Tax=Platanthera guangdongensis TaxID=2320717 RepID=A0ABR2LF23_9ASPA